MEEMHSAEVQGRWAYFAKPTESLLTVTGETRVELPLTGTGTEERRLEKTTEVKRRQGELEKTTEM